MKSMWTDIHNHQESMINSGKPVVFIIEAQSLTALTTIRAIGDRGYCIGFYTGGFEKSSALHSKNWNALIALESLNKEAVEKIISIGKQAAIRFKRKPILMTATDDGVLFLSSFYHRFSQIFDVPIPDANDVKLLMHKSLFYKWAEKNSFPIAKTIICDDYQSICAAIDTFDLPFILKPKVRDEEWNRLFPNEKIIVISSPDEKKNLIEKRLTALSGIDGIIIQNLIHGGDEAIYFVLAAIDMNGKIVASFSGRKLAQWPLNNGSTLVCVPYENPELESITSTLFSKLRMRGLASVEYKRCERTGNFYIIEPTVGRCDHQSLIAEYCGVNLVSTLINTIGNPHFKNKPLSIKKYRVWLDEIAFLRLVKLSLKATFRVIRLIQFKNLIRVRPLLFRWADKSPFICSISSLLGFRKKLQRFEIRQISELEFSGMRQNWNELLKASNANDLFMSWEWIKTWWDVWGKDLNLELYLHGIYDQGQLIGILPLYYFNERRLGLREYQFIGNTWGRFSTIRSEYMSAILDARWEVPLDDYINRWIRKRGVLSHLIFSDVTEPHAFTTNSVIRKVEQGYRLDTSGSLEVYKAKLSSATRLKVFNRREYLARKYTSFEFGFYQLDNGNVDFFFRKLNDFHRLRWGRPCFDELAVRFHKTLISSLDQSHVKLSYLKINDEVVSLSYNLLMSRCAYNIQSGYKEDFDKKIALGSLHFGYLIEEFFYDNAVDQFDLLAGRGKSSNYKESFRGAPENFFTVQVFPSGALRGIVKSALELKRAVNSLKPK